MQYCDAIAASIRRRGMGVCEKDPIGARPPRENGTRKTTGVTTSDIWASVHLVSVVSTHRTRAKAKSTDGCERCQEHISAVCGGSNAQRWLRMPCTAPVRQGDCVHRHAEACEIWVVHQVIHETRQALLSDAAGVWRCSTCGFGRDIIGKLAAECRPPPPQLLSDKRVSAQFEYRRELMQCDRAEANEFSNVRIQRRKPRSANTTFRRAPAAVCS